MNRQVLAARTERREQATSIALDILRDRDILNLRPARIAVDVVRRYGVPSHTARRAVSLARKNAGVTA